MRWSLCCRLAQKDPYIWFGTCELTVKSGKYIHIPPYPYQQVEHVLTIYRGQNRILRENRQAKIIVLECPYFLAYRWNKFQGRKYSTQTEETEKKQDTELKSIVQYFNDQLKLINRDRTTPKISQDQIISSKKKEYHIQNTK